MQRRRRKLSIDEQQPLERGLRSRRSRPRGGKCHTSSGSDACGLFAEYGKKALSDALQGMARHRHRGGYIDLGNGKLCDGAGISLQLAAENFADLFPGTSLNNGDLGVFMLYLSPERREQMKEIAESVIREQRLFGANVRFAWREVPINREAIPEAARHLMPEIWQLVVLKPTAVKSQWEFDRMLFFARKAMERRVYDELNLGNAEMYVASSSAHLMVYKGLIPAESIGEIFSDLTTFTGVNWAQTHVRYSTNTTSTFDKAQPCRTLAHNGEIVTIEANEKWVDSVSPALQLFVHERFPEFEKELFPILRGGSDSAKLDAVAEWLHFVFNHQMSWVLNMLCGYPWHKDPSLSPEETAMWAYLENLCPPFDGPVGLIYCDGRHLGTRVDNSGYRPIDLSGDGERVVFSSTIAASEPDAAKLPFRERAAGGGMAYVDLSRGTIVTGEEIRRDMVSHRNWLNLLKVTELLSTSEERHNLWTKIKEGFSKEGFLRLFGWRKDGVERELRAALETGKEAIIGLGDGSERAWYSRFARSFFNYFSGLFNQITAPASDPNREGYLTSTAITLGRRIADFSFEQLISGVLRLSTPVLTPQEFDGVVDFFGDKLQFLDITVTSRAQAKTVKNRLNTLCREAERLVRGGVEVLVLTDQKVGKGRMQIPSALALAAVRKHLQKRGLARDASLVVATGEMLMTPEIDTLIALGASAVLPWGVYLYTADMTEPEKANHNYQKAMTDGLLKRMATSGIANVEVYVGSVLLETYGLSSALVRDYFSTPMEGMPGGVTMREVVKVVRAWHADGMEDPNTRELPILGYLDQVNGGEKHTYSAEWMRLVHKAREEKTYEAWLTASEAAERSRIGIRQFLEIRGSQQASELTSEYSEAERYKDERVQAVLARLLTGSMSVGALRLRYHRILALGARIAGVIASGGEGGEDDVRLTRADATEQRQVASGRFGVDLLYLLLGFTGFVSELQIKVAQGAKPGEGGQLQGFKVTEVIAIHRRTKKGTTLLSPPPHLSIFSIEDIADLILTLKRVNPFARVSVKVVVNRVYLRSVVVGLAKAGADDIHISGNVGGTGASPISSTRSKGGEIELGVALAHRALVEEGLRSFVTITADGGVRNARDMFTLIALGADRVAGGTLPMYFLGCVGARKCYDGSCPALTTGKSEMDDLNEPLESLQAEAEQVATIYGLFGWEFVNLLHGAGIDSVEELVGNKAALRAVGNRPEAKLLLEDPYGKTAPEYRGNTFERNPLRNEPSILEKRMLGDSSLGTRRDPVCLTYDDQSFLTRFASGRVIARRKAGKDPWKTPIRKVYSTGTPGEGAGSFADFIKWRHSGYCDDHLGQGLGRRAKIVILPPKNALVKDGRITMAGNTVGYGFFGTIYLRGSAGNRAGVRSSGGTLVCLNPNGRAVGDSSFNFASDGKAIILGEVGRNFASGIGRGAVAFVYDPNNTVESRLGNGAKCLEGIPEEHFERFKEILADYVKETRMKGDNTGNYLPLMILSDIQNQRSSFKTIVAA